MEGAPDCGIQGLKRFGAVLPEWAVGFAALEQMREEVYVGRDFLQLQVILR